jgi:hypothetical protein
MKADKRFCTVSARGRLKTNVNHIYIYK